MRGGVHASHALPIPLFCLPLCVCVCALQAANVGDSAAFFIDPDACQLAAQQPQQAQQLLPFFSPPSYLYGGALHAPLR